MESKKPNQDRDSAAQLELQHLERQFRQMKNDVGAVPATIRKTISKQKKLIQDLENEKEELLRSLSVVDRKPAKDEHEKISREVVNLLLGDKQLDEDIAAKQENLKDLISQIEAGVRKIENKKRTRGGDELMVEAFKKEEKYDENLENRLHTEARRYDEEMTRTSNYGRQVEDLLKERELFKKEFSTLSKDLVTGNKIICDLIEQSSYAFVQRREAGSKLNALKTKAKQEMLQTCSEARQLERTILHEMKLNAFLAKKSQRRIDGSIEDREITKSDGVIKEMTDFLDKYGQIVNEIKEKFGEDDLDRLVMQFMKLEEDNYNMCRFINDLNQKLEPMRAEVCRLQKSITDRRETNNQEKEEQLKIIENLENEIEIKKRMVKTSRRELKSAEESVETLLGGISELFFLADCNPDEIVQKLGKNQKVRADNVMMYLKTLEHRFKELKIINDQFLKSVGSSRTSSGSETSSIDEEAPAIRTELPDTPCPLCAEARDLSEVNDSLAVQLTIDEWREKFQKEVKKESRSDLLHSVANCPLPKSRRIMQKRKGL